VADRSCAGVDLQYSQLAFAMFRLINSGADQAPQQSGPRHDFGTRAGTIVAVCRGSIALGIPKPPRISQ
jgi:hypothetical protein